MKVDLTTLVLILVSITESFQQTAPTSPVITAPFSAKEGTQVTFNCSTVNGNPPPSVTWYRGQSVVDSTYSTAEQVSYNEYTFNATRNDHGVTFRCEVLNAALSRPHVRSWLITVFVQPSEPIISGPSVIKGGISNTHRCESANGNPAPNIKWLLGSTTFTQGINTSIVPNSDNTYTTNSTLTWIPEAKDSGKSLICEVIPSLALQTALTENITITVLEAPTIPVINAPLSTNEGRQVTFNCSTVNGNPPPSVTWYRGQSVVDSTYSTAEQVSYNEYTFNATRNDHGVTFRCEVFNTVISRPLVRYWLITVFVQPSEPIISGASVIKGGINNTHRCESANGNPAPTIKWLLGNTTFTKGIKTSIVPSSDNTYTSSSNLTWIPEVKDSGKSLICQTMLSLALQTTLTDKITITVLVTPSKPTISGPTLVKSGIKYTYSCESANGNPAPTIHWLLGSTDIVQGIQTYTVQNIDKTFTVTSNLTWIPGVKDSGNALICEVTHNQTLTARLADRINVTVQDNLGTAIAVSCAALVLCILAVSVTVYLCRRKLKSPNYAIEQKGFESKLVRWS